MISLALLVLINMQYSNQFNWGVALSSIAISAAVLTLETFCSAVINDANLRIDFELIAKNLSVLDIGLLSALLPLL